MHFLAISWANGWATMIKLEIRRAIVILSKWSPWQYLFDKDYSTSVQRLEFKIWKIILCAAGLKEFLHLVLDPARCMENELTLQIVWRTNWRFLTDKICKTASSSNQSPSLSSFSNLTLLDVKNTKEDPGTHDFVYCVLGKKSTLISQCSEVIHLVWVK